MYALRPQKVDFEKVWANLRGSVVRIIQLQPVDKMDWDHKFSDVYNMCVSIPESQSAQLYSSLVECIEDHVKGLYETIRTVPNDELLATYAHMWKVYYSGAHFVHMLFGYLNRQFVNAKRLLDPDYSEFSRYISKQELKEVGCMALDIWKCRLAEPIFKKLLVLLLEAIAEDRKGTPPLNKSVVQEVILSLALMEQNDFVDTNLVNMHTSKQDAGQDFYQQHFEIHYLRETEQHYSQLATELLQNLPCSRYMESVIKIIEEEKQRSGNYVHKATVEKVTKLCQTVMVSSHKEKLNGFCADLIRNEETDDLKNMYRLMKPIEGGLSVMVREFQEYIRKKGLEAVSTLSGENIHNQFVENILQVYDRYNEMKTNVFLDDAEFNSALDKALQTVVNSRPEHGQPTPKASERLARFCDALLRKNTKSQPEVDIDGCLSRAIVIFRYIDDKDVFQKFYAKMLSNRLINNSSMSMDAEESMISKLKAACGYEFTSKLTRMFTDIGLCDELHTDFERHLKEQQQQLKFAMAPYVLTAGSWPLSPPTAGTSGTPPTHIESVGFVLPMELKLATDLFQEYYVQKYNGRKLTWLYNSCSGEVRAGHLDKAYQISGSLFQISVLLLFNHHDSQSVSDIGASVGLTGDLLLKICQTHVSQGLLTCSDRELNAASQLHFNPSFTSRRLKFKLPAVQSTKQAEKETEAVNHTVAQDRKYYVECAVVRIMKTRKVLRHNQLVQEVMEQIKDRFKPDLTLVKKCVEDLIDKLYIQRTDKHDEYQYLA